MTSIALAARPTPSPGLRLNSAASALIEEAANTRNEAVTRGVDISWSPDAVSCRGARAEATFYSDGTADALEICLIEDDQELRLRMNVLIGRLSEVKS